MGVFFFGMGYSSLATARAIHRIIDADVPISGTTRTEDGLEALADSQEAQTCYTSRWLEFAYGRTLTERDDTLRTRLADEPRSVRDIVQTLTTSPDFLSRDVTEAAQ